MEFLNRVTREIKQLAITSQLQEFSLDSTTIDAPSQNPNLFADSNNTAKISSTTVVGAIHRTNQHVTLLRKDFDNLYRYCKVMERKLKQREKTDHMLLDVIDVLREQIADLQSKVQTTPANSNNNSNQRKRKFEALSEEVATENEAANHDDCALPCGSSADICTFSSAMATRARGGVNDRKECGVKRMKIDPSLEEATNDWSEPDEQHFDSKFVERDINM